MADTNIKGLANRARPAIAGNGVWTEVRTSRYGEVVADLLGGAKIYPVADEGSYFVATNPTMGTAIAGLAAADGFDALEALLHIRNTSTSKQLYLDYVLLHATVAGASGTNFNVIISGDRGATRWSSGGSTITPVNPNMASSATPEVTMKFGALVLAAASADVRLLGDYRLRTVIKVIGDTYLFTFGDSRKALDIGMATEGTLQLARSVSCPPVILGENDQFMVHEAAASQAVTGASYLFSMGFWMR